jgi:hypothetical protein
MIRTLSIATMAMIVALASPTLAQDPQPASAGKAAPSTKARPGVDKTPAAEDDGRRPLVHDTLTC